MRHWITQKRWAVSLLVVAAVGCSQVHRPRLDEGGKVGGERVVAAADASSSDESVGKLDSNACDAMTGAASINNHRIEEYGKLRALLREMSPSIQSDVAILGRAHRVALSRTISRVQNILENCGKDGEEKEQYRGAAKAFSSRVKKYYRNYRQFPKTGDEQDLSGFVLRALQLEEETPLSNAFLDMFFTDYIRAVDPFGSIVFGSTNTPSEPNTLGMSMLKYLPEELKSVPPVQHLGRQGSVLWISLRDWRSGPDADSVIGALDSVSRSREIGSIVFDLRFAGGSELPLLNRMLESSRRPGAWSELPIFALVNYETHGAPAVFVYELATKANVQVSGTAGQTYGYGRTLVQRAVTLVDGLAPVNVTIGAEELQPFATPNRDGYQYKLNLAYVRGALSSAEILARAEDAASRFERPEHAPGQDGSADQGGQMEGAQPPGDLAQPMEGQLSMQMQPPMEMQPPVEMQPMVAPQAPEFMEVAPQSEGSAQVAPPESMPLNVERNGAPPRVFGP